MTTTAKGGNKNRKYGRNSAACTRYVAENRRMKNKLRRIVRHLKKHPFDIQVIELLEKKYNISHDRLVGLISG